MEQAQSNQAGHDDFYNAVAAYIVENPPRGWTNESTFKCFTEGLASMPSTAPEYNMKEIGSVATSKNRSQAAYPRASPKNTTPELSTLVRKIELNNNTGSVQTYHIKECVETKLESRIHIDEGVKIPGVTLPLMKPPQLQGIGSDPQLKMQTGTQQIKSEVAPDVSVNPGSAVSVSIYGSCKVWHGRFTQRVRIYGEVRVNLYDASNRFFSTMPIPIVDLAKHVNARKRQILMTVIESGAIEMTYKGQCSFQVNSNTKVDTEEYLL